MMHEHPPSEVEVTPSIAVSTSNMSTNSHTTTTSPDQDMSARDSAAFSASTPASPFPTSDDGRSDDAEIPMNPLKRDEDDIRNSVIVDRKNKDSFLQPEPTSPGELTDSEGLLDNDDRLLTFMGYKSELMRGLNGFMNFAFCFTAVNVISSLATLYGYGLATGGPAVMVWWWKVGSVLTILVGLSMAEIASSYPCAGSVYHWSGQLAPREWAPLASYITGWFNFLGNAAGDASFAFGFASTLAAVVNLQLSDDSQLDSYTIAGIAQAILVFWGILNVLRVDQQGWLNNIAAVYQILSTIVIIAVLASTASVQTAEFVYTETYNGTGFDSFGYVALIGVLTTVYSFSGYEAGAHMSEETKSAARVSPWGIIGTCVCCAVVGYAFIVSMLFATVDIGDTLANSTNAAVYVFTNCLPETNCGVGLGWLVVINLFFAGVSSVAVTSRIGFAMARDGAFPASSVLKQVNQLFKVPLNCIIMVVIFDLLILILNYFSSQAFNAITSLTTIGFQISYAIPIFLRITFKSKTFRRSSFHLGDYSIVIGAISVFWLVFTSMILFWPQTDPVSSVNMNYACVMVGGVFIIGGVFWIFSARHWFTGPTRMDKD